MGFLSSLFGAKATDLDIRKGILAYCYGNLPALSLSSPVEFLSTFSDDGDNALKARISTAAKLRAGVQLDKEAVRDVTARFDSIEPNYSCLIFDFSKYGGIFELTTGNRAICPSYVTLIFDSAAQRAFLYFLEPSVEVGTAMLIQVMEDGTRFNLGDAPNSGAYAFLECVKSRLENVEENEPYDDEFLDVDENNDLEVAVERFEIEFGFTLDKLPDPDPVVDLFDKLSVGLSQDAQISLFYRLVVMNFLVTAVLMKRSGETVTPDSAAWLTQIVDRAVDYSQQSVDHFDLEQVTSKLNEGISSYFEELGVFRG